MVSLEELKQIVMMRHLTDAMIESLRPHIDILHFVQEEMIFREGDKANRLYLLKRGKVLLEKKMSKKITLYFDSIKEGYSFGWSAMLDGGSYTSHAICAEPCEVFSLRKKTIIDLMNKDHDLGYILTQRILRVMKNRLDHRTNQFLRSIVNQPDMQNLF
ncbi:MAG: cyclic nucleotide-binding domain-containing protein [Deltaproteobacteria bacterium]|nr:cyclic nucleotide-binding domain-containing protein [Deltaproteobacteria bacterium]